MNNTPIGIAIKVLTELEKGNEVKIREFILNKVNDGIEMRNDDFIVEIGTINNFIKLCTDNSFQIGIDSEMTINDLLTIIGDLNTRYKSLEAKVKHLSQ